MRDQSVLGQASESVRLLLQELAAELRLTAGEMLFSQGDPGDALFFVDEGAVEISIVSADGRKLSLNIMRPGEVFGEIALLDGSPRTATATALEPTALRRVRRADLLGRLAERSDLALDFIHLLCYRLRWVHGLLEDRAFLPLPRRVAKRLLMLSEQNAARDGTIELSQADLADFLGATREAVAKVLGTFRARGIIELSRGAIRVRDRQALLKAAEIRSIDIV